jgi:hypothetical protein
MKKSVDTGYCPPNTLNPFDVGDYRAFAATFPTAEGKFCAVIFVDKLTGSPDCPRPAINMERLKLSFDSRSEAEQHAIEYASFLIKDGAKLLA